MLSNSLQSLASSDCIIIPTCLGREFGVQSLRGYENFPADCPHRSDFHRDWYRGTVGYYTSFRILVTEVNAMR